MPDLAAMEPLLIPTPRSVMHLGGWVQLDESPGATPALRCVRVENLRPEAYRLEINADADTGVPRITISAATATGEARARATLHQLATQYGSRLPRLIIEDQPLYPARGVMLDVSRDRVPTMGHCAEIGRVLSGLKVNHIQLYTEHTFAYAGHEEVWKGWSPLTPAEVRLLARRWGDLHIDLAANQNCFGHLASWLRHDKYRHLAETHGDWVFDVWPRSGPFSLCPTDPRSLELVDDLLGQLLPCFSSGLVNIGCDETYDVGFGRSKDDVARRGKAAVYLEFVARVGEVARRHGKRSMFWADIALSHPECVKDIPPDMISLAWGYEADSPFRRWCELLAEAGREVWVCPGTSSWRSITGRTLERRGNIEAAARAGVAGGATGMLVCDWGDTGHHQQWPVALNAMAHGAAAAWNAEASVDPRAVSLHVFGDRSLAVGGWLDRLGDADLRLRESCGALSHPDRTRLRNQSALFIDMFKGLEEQVGVGAVEDWEEARARVEESAAVRPAGLNLLIGEELDHTLEVARFAAARGAGKRRPGGLNAESRKDLAERLEAIIGEHRRLWRVRSREGGLEHSCGFYRKIAL